VLNIYAGATLIGTYSGSTGNINALRTVTVTSDVSDPSLNGQPITFEIVSPASGNGGDILVDNVQGTVRSASGSTPAVPGVTDSHGRLIPDEPVAGCPNNTDFGGTEYWRTGDQLDDRDLLFDVDVGGDGFTQVSSCPGIPGWGYFSANPTFTLNLSGMNDMEELEIETNGTSCDTVLLIRDSAGNWYFDDDGGPNLESKIKFEEDDFNMAQFNGVVDVLVGTYGGNQCSFEMEIDTED
jgi:hypothetical protein